MKDCTFCKIISGKIPADKIYEDDKVLAFLDIDPVAKGHALLIPKEHYQLMTDTPDELVGYCFVKAKELMIRIKKSMGADYISVSVSGIDIPHFHIHLIPRTLSDGLPGWPKKKYEEGEMEKVAEKIREK